MVINKAMLANLISQAYVRGMQQGMISQLPAEVQPRASVSPESAGIGELQIRRQGAASSGRLLDMEA